MGTFYIFNKEEFWSAYEDITDFLYPRDIFLENFRKFLAKVSSIFAVHFDNGMERELNHDFEEKRTLSFKIQTFTYS